MAIVLLNCYFRIRVRISSDALKDPVSIAGVSILDRERESMSGDQSETIETTSSSETEVDDIISLQVPPRSLRYTCTIHQTW
eukprot:CAMPEP_0204618264 /NCGR_PEP_ID=MMETSP0717-20131115/4974_1 /ASSEMBLY_ACC=CAM_ASM_000666 /TAXON_ID=230516 /ORGANISM="Chaetoceros curvisetus" /LENGTH=81 /DNA_ID=CAMNT_0051631963 /DNA_START=319 /DNA_END=561 /DNA_ORIENTATION=+